MSKRIICVIGLFVLVIMFACTTPKTKVTSIWKDETYHKLNIKKILIIGVSEKQDIRAKFEEMLAEQLKTKGIDAVPSYTVLPSDKMLDRLAILTQVKQLSIEGVLITRLLYREFIDKPEARDQNWYSFYTTSYGYIPVRSGPIAAPEKQLFHVKTNLYDIKTDKPVFSVTTESVITEKIDERGIRSFIDVIMKSLSDEKLI